jgi:uncharacterized protein YjiS (DUF1127 family)
MAVRLAACVGTASANFPFAVVSWMISELIAGYAAYGEAMYFTAIIADDRVEPECTPSSSGDSGARPLLLLVSNREPDAESDELSRSGQAEEVTHPAQTIDTFSRWYRMLPRPIAALLSKIHDRRARRRAIVLLNTSDDRAPRDIGITRRDIETTVSAGAWRERCDRGPAH